MREFYRSEEPVKLLKQNNDLKKQKQKRTKKNGRGRGKDCYKIRMYLNTEMILFVILIQTSQVWKGHFADNWGNFNMNQVSDNKKN